jgi:hypothetical protein
MKLTYLKSLSMDSYEHDIKQKQSFSLRNKLMYNDRQKSEKKHTHILYPKAYNFGSTSLKKLTGPGNTNTGSVLLIGLRVWLCGLKCRLEKCFVHSLPAANFLVLPN